MRVLLSAALAAAAAGLLVALPPPGRLRFEDLQPDVTPWSPGGPEAPARWLPASWGLAPWVLVAPAALVVGPVPALLGAGGLLVGRRVQRARRRSRAAADERRRAVEACGALAAELRAGRDPADALQAAAQAAAGTSRLALAGAAAAARLGGDVPAALSTAPGSAVADVMRSLAACWAVCARSGSGLAAAVERLEEGLRADQAQRRAVEAELAGPRATAGLLAVLPAAGLLMAVGLGADPLHVLLETPVGAVCLVLGLGLDALGVAWTARLVARAGGRA
jgi:tight adherence protein B